MEEPRELEEADEAPDPEADQAAGGWANRRNLATRKHLAEVDSEAAFLGKLAPTELRSALREVVAGSRAILPETLVRLSVAAHDAGDRRLLSLSFEALTKTVTPLLAKQAWDLTGEDIRDQVQEVLEQLFEDIRAGKSGMAGRVFAAWAKRRSIDLYRKRAARFEGAFARKEPTPDGDPLDEVADRVMSQEAQVMLGRHIRVLPTMFAQAFIRVHVFGMTRAEVAKQMDVDVRTLHDWLKKSAEVLGHDGEEDETD
jgi:DNA-directed RNA polymerase specialized sigma24 family protein